MKLLMVDNFDSFTFNLVHYLQVAGAVVDVLRNDKINNVDMSSYNAIVLSPGPGRPENAAELMPFVEQWIGKKPMLGICLGMQAIGLQYQWEISASKIPVHGKAREITHSGKGIFASLPSPILVGRYHSLVIQRTENSQHLQIEAVSGDEIMAVSDEANKIWGLQFHPESVLTSAGQQILSQWVKLIGHQ